MFPLNSHVETQHDGVGRRVGYEGRCLHDGVGALIKKVLKKSLGPPSTM